eukprot:tig00000498_g1606.t1
MMSPGPVQAGELPEESDFDLVELAAVAPGVRLDLRYATADNFVGRPLYETRRCFARRAVAYKLAAAQRELERMGLTLLVWDLYRPRGVQQALWAITPDERYVADPRKGSNHNRAAAVDCTLADRAGAPLPMPSPFDDFSERAHRGYEGGTAEQRANRDLLEEVMAKHGFIGLPTEWWHFDCGDAAGYELLDVPLGRLAAELDRQEAEGWASRGARLPFYPLFA